MAIYQYRAFTRDGREKAGHIDAPTAQSAQAKLKKQSLYVKELKEDIGKRDRQLFPFLSKMIYRVSRKEISLFARQLGTLLGAGIPLNEALSDIIEQTPNIHLQKALTEMRADVTEGKKLSEALASKPDFFPPVYENMVRVGEATGSYELTLRQLSELEEKNAELKSKALTSMVYPIFMGGLTFAVLLFLLVFVVPQLETIYSNFKAELPFVTRFVLGLSSIAQNFWHISILILLAGFYALYRYRQTPTGKIKVDETLLKLPLYGNLTKSLEVSRFTRNLSAMLNSKVPLLTSLEIVAQTVSTEVFRKEIQNMIHTIQEGGSLKAAISSSEILPHMAKGMISAGEASDRLDELTLKTADIMETEVENTIKRLSAMIEPIMIVVMGLLVLFIMLAIILPLSQMSNLIGK